MFTHVRRRIVEAQYGAGRQGMTAAERLLTVDEFLALPDWDAPAELLDGKIVEYPPHGALHGYTTASVSWFLGNHQRQKRSGFALSCAPAVILSREPARVRCPDVCFVTIERLPAGPLPYFLEVVPDLIV